MTASRARASRAPIRALNAGWPADARASEWLAAYTPTSVTSTAWDTGVGDFARTQAGRLLVDLATLKRLTRVISRLAAWCHDNGIALDVETVLDPDTVERFLVLGAASEPQTTVATWRSDLRRVGPALTKLAPWEPAPKALSRAALAPPYTAAELRVIERDAPHQGTPERSRAVRALVALGLGAGLDGRWNAKVRGSDVVEHTLGVLVKVSGRQQRDVEVRDRYRAEIIELAEIAGDAPLIGREFGKNASNAVARRAEIDQGRVLVHVGRLRSTWIVAHLSAGTHLRTLVRAAGVEHVGALRDLMAFVAEPAAADAADQLRRA